MRFGLYKNTPVIFSRFKRRRLKRYFVFYISLFIIFFVVYLFFERVYPNYVSRVEIYANNIATSAINSTLSETMEKGHISSDFVNISTGSDGSVTSVEADTVKMNSFKAALVSELQKKIDNLPEGYVTIPLGSLLNKEIFSGLGPKMKIKTIPNGLVKVDFSEDFVSCGINQVKHKIYLDVSVTITVVSATMYKSRTVNTTVPISETVISGVVPHYYGGNMSLAADNSDT